MTTAATAPSPCLHAHHGEEGGEVFCRDCGATIMDSLAWARAETPEPLGLALPKSGHMDSCGCHGCQVRERGCAICNGPVKLGMATCAGCGEERLIGYPQLPDTSEPTALACSPEDETYWKAYAEQHPDSCQCDECLPF